MKKLTILALVLTMTFSMAPASSASDWEDAGKALAIIGGLRVLTGGELDVIGSVTGIKDRHRHRDRYAKRRHRHKYKRHHRHECSKRVWVPEYRWKRKYVPEHESYDPECGKIIVEGHYIRYKVEDGGYWDTQDCIH